MKNKNFRYMLLWGNCHENFLKTSTIDAFEILKES